MTDKPVYGPGEGYDPDLKPSHLRPEQRCTARKTRTNLRCGQPHMEEQRVCRMHGGSSRQAKGAAAKRKVERETLAVLARLDVDPINDPLTELGKLAGQVVAWKDALAAKVNELTAIRYENLAGGEQLRAEVALFERAMDRCGQVLGLIAKLNVDARLATIEESKARAVVAAIDAGLAAAGVTGTAATEARQAVARHLRAVG